MPQPEAKPYSRNGALSRALETLFVGPYVIRLAWNVEAAEAAGYASIYVREGNDTPESI